MNRLEQLHKAYEEKETYKQEGWMFTHNELPPHESTGSCVATEVVNGVTVWICLATWLIGFQMTVWYSQG